MSLVLVLLMILTTMLRACTGTPGTAPTPSAFPVVHKQPATEREVTTAQASETVPSAVAMPSVPPAVDEWPRDRRDPFVPVRSSPEGPAESVLASARLTGIVRSAQGGALALVETPEGAGLILRAGERFGGGRLVDVGQDFALFDLESPSATSPRRLVLRLEPAS